MIFIKLRLYNPKTNTGYLVKTRQLFKGKHSNCWGFLNTNTQGNQSMVQQLFNVCWQRSPGICLFISADKFYRCRSTAETALIWQWSVAQRKEKEAPQGTLVPPLPFITHRQKTQWFFSRLLTKERNTELQVISHNSMCSLGKPLAGYSTPSLAGACALGQSDKPEPMQNPNDTCNFFSCPLGLKAGSSVINRTWELQPEFTAHPNCHPHGSSKGARYRRQRRNELWQEYIPSQEAWLHINM